jgi:flavin-dependent dehydrogenase
MFTDTCPATTPRPAAQLPDTSKPYDVVIAGGGPAGAAVATFLARDGYRCLIAEQSHFPRYHIGESLIPNTHGIFKRLGLLPKLEASNFPEKYGVRFFARDGREATPFHFFETVEGDAARTWQVERSRFDRMLLDHARENGVDVCEDTSVENVLFENGRAVGLEIWPRGGERREVRGRVVVDASGRKTLIGRQLKLRTGVPGLTKGSAWGYYRGGKRWPGIDAGETTMFLIPGGGWFWYIPLPDDVISVGIVAESDYLYSDGGKAEDVLEREVRKCAPLCERLSEAERIGTAFGSYRLAYLNTRTSGDGWVMVGDARAFLDPIYSSGLYLALSSAELAADAIGDALEMDDVSGSRLGSFEPKLMAGVDVIRRLIHAFYDPSFTFADFVRRFPEQRPALIDCLVGDVLKDMTPFKTALEQMTPAPPPLM